MLNQTKFVKSRKNLKRISGIFRRSVIPVQGLSAFLGFDNLRLLPKTVEANRKVIRRFLKKKVKVFIYVFVNMHITQKPSDLRMGKGKGNPKYSAISFKKGKKLFEVTHSTKIFKFGFAFIKANKKNGFFSN